MEKKELLQRAFENAKDCLVIDFLTSTITFIRGTERKVYNIGESEIDAFILELADKGLMKDALNLRVCALGRYFVIGRNKGFEKFIKDMHLTNKVKPLDS